MLAKKIIVATPAMRKEGQSTAPHSRMRAADVSSAAGCRTSSSRGFLLTRRLLFRRQAVDIGGDDVGPILAEHVAVRRHHALASVADRLLDRGQRAAVEPDVVGQVRR